MIRALPGNDEIAEIFEQVADLLEAQNANPYRVRAYRNAAVRVRALERSIPVMLHDEGRHKLEELPGIGRSIAASIEELVLTGRLRLHERLMGEVSPEGLFTLVPGIGEALAHRIHERLGIETLEELEMVAHNGRLIAVPGFGARRTRAVRDALNRILSQASRRRLRILEQREREVPFEARQPSIEALLSVDVEYRRHAEANKLRTIAPRRFNPQARSWLPILHTEREGWALTAMFSNTAQAHKLNRTRDWVVIYFEREGVQGQCTVVTEYRGAREGMRVVRGREQEANHRGSSSEEKGDASDRARN